MTPSNWMLCGLFGFAVFMAGIILLAWPFHMNIPNELKEEQKKRVAFMSLAAIVLGPIFIFVYLLSAMLYLLMILKQDLRR